VLVAKRMMCVHLTPNTFPPRTDYENIDRAEGYSAAFSLAPALHAMGGQRHACATFPPETSKGAR
jgi:hypothetical protein